MALGAGVKREGFSSTLGVLAATLGSAVGLGNIWKFPYLTGTYGGAAFIVVYLVSVLVAGLPVMISEFLIGRRTRTNAVDALRKLAPGSAWYLVGVSGVAAAYLILAFYTSVAGWVYAYIFKALSGVALSTSPKVTSAAFVALSTSPVEPLIWQAIVLFVTGAIVSLGVRAGIEGATRKLMPLLFLILIICDARALLLPGAAKGLAFLFRPDFTKIGAAAVLTGLGLAFFKLSVGMGTMMTYGSYIGADQNLPFTAFRVMLADTTISLLAGVAIFPAVFSFGFQPDAGPSLLFITIPAVFSSMPLGWVFMTLFFVLAAIAATGAMISLYEVPVCFLCEHFCWRRPVASTAVGLSLLALGSTATWSFSLLKDVHLFGKTFFDLYDYASSNLLLPIGGIFIALFIGWRWGLAGVKGEGTNHGALRNGGTLRLFYVVTKFVAPVAIALVLLNGLGVLRF
jgi:NSS family neurotransmitter:Na+ symporter